MKISFILVYSNIPAKDNRINDRTMKVAINPGNSHWYFFICAKLLNSKLFAQTYFPFPDPLFIIDIYFFGFDPQRFFDINQLLKGV